MISTLLIEWYERNKRDLPWRATASAYKIWLSEIILQQTRVNQGLEYYNRFIRKFPEVEALAKASIDDVLKMWQGLGYYTRARNLHTTANLIVRDHGGVFPDSYDQLRQLKGIGPYTAAAVASFAFKRPVALVDGNVYRLIARLFDIHTPVTSSAGKKIISGLAQEILSKETPDIHNQAMMEFGALVCLPHNPKCNTCVLSVHCLAREQGTISVLPVKTYRMHNRTRYFNYLYIIHNQFTWIRKRNGNDIWNSLYEFPLIETQSEDDFIQLTRSMPWTQFISDNKPLNPIHTADFKQKLSHQQLVCRFFCVESNAKPNAGNDYIQVRISDLHKYAIPRVIDRYLQDMSKRRKLSGLNE